METHWHYHVNVDSKHLLCAYCVYPFKCMALYRVASYIIIMYLQALVRLDHENRKVLMESSVIYVSWNNEEVLSHYKIYFYTCIHRQRSDVPVTIFRVGEDKAGGRPAETTSIGVEKTASQGKGTK